MRVIRDVLPTPLTTRALEANDRDLPTYAEAVPDEFLTILERDLITANPAVLGLLRPVGSGPFSHPSRSGLLWALEGLSWNPETLPRVALILARLARVQINDNWSNKPINSLEAIFRAWMPQTAATHQQRIELMKVLAVKFPDIAWKLCIAQFGTHHKIGEYSHKPRWRSDGYGFGEPFQTWEPIIDFTREIVEMTLTWTGHSQEMLCDLIDRMHDLSDVDQARVWALVKAWASTASDADKSVMREKIRVSTLSRHAVMRAKKNNKTTELASTGAAVYAALEPSDLLNRHAWLFRDGWVEESADEIDDIDFDKRDERIKNLRTNALREILEHRGLVGVLELSKQGGASWIIGGLMITTVLSEQEIKELLRLALTPIFAGEHEVYPHKNLIGGALRAITDIEKREAILETVADNLSEDETAQLFVLAPFCSSTWKLVDMLGETAREKYWRKVIPDWLRGNDAENNEAVERLLRAKRPRAAFSCVKYRPAMLNAKVLFDLLTEIAQGGSEEAGQYMLDHHHVEEAFKHLNSSPTFTREQKAGLEFAYIEALSRRWDRKGKYGIPNLERYIEGHPEVFTQAVVWSYRRKYGAADPAEFQVAPESAKTMAERGHKLLDAIERIPGHNELEELKGDRLLRWVATIRQRCAELSRADIADICLGKLLSNAPIGKDGVWPCEPVRDVMEEIQSEQMMNGARNGVYNSRGIHSRGEGGKQERELAEKYRKWGQALQTSHPFVASKLLIDLAKTYDNEASREDTEAGIRRRLR